MTLVDTSVWVDHLRAGDAAMAALLAAGQVLMHPFVISEIALGFLHHRARVLRGLAQLPEALVATDGEVVDFIGHHPLPGRGIGYVDAHLLVSARLTPNAQLWTRDRRLLAVAQDAGVATA